MVTHLHRPLLIGLALVWAAGCQRGDPLDWSVKAKDARGLASWRVLVEGKLSAEKRRQLQEALQEIRLNISGNRELDRWAKEGAASSQSEAAASKESVDDILYRRIDGRRLGEVIQLGYELRVRRLKEELTGLETAVKGNERLVTRPGDVESRHYLEGLRERQMARVEKYRLELGAAERELAPMLEASGKPLLEPSTGDMMGTMPQRVK